MVYDRVTYVLPFPAGRSDTVQCLKSVFYVTSTFDRINSLLGNSSYCILMSLLMAFETETSYLSDKLWLGMANLKLILTLVQQSMFLQLPREKAEADNI